MMRFLWQPQKTQVPEEAGTMKSDCGKCWIVFPKFQESLSDFLISEIKEKHENVEFDCIFYEKIDKSTIVRINKAFRESCILIIGYVEELSHEICYKLGLAHGCRRQLILVRFHSLTEDSPFYTLPQYIRTNFFVSCTDQELEGFFKEISNLLDYVLAGDLSTLLYQKALKICLSLERDSMHHIDRVNQELFDHRNSISSQKLTIDSYLNDDKDLYWRLAFLIAKEPKDVRNAFIALERKVKEHPRAISTDVQSIINEITFISVENAKISQYGNGDNFAGNKVDGGSR